MRLIDSHGHVNAERFADDVDVVLAESRAAGLERMLVPGWNHASSQRALALVEEHGWLDAAVGIHPHDAARVTEAEWADIEGWARDERVLAIGETGLDSDRLFSPWEAQLENLRRNLALALATGKPAVLHCRSRPGTGDAQEALVAELCAAGIGGPAGTAAFGDRPPAIVHSYSGPVDYARAMVDLGCAVSFSGLVFRRGEEPAAEAVTLVPAERLLVETDSPFLSPPGAPRGRMEPRYVEITARWAMARRGETDEGRFGDALVAAYDATFRSRG